MTDVTMTDAAARVVNNRFDDLAAEFDNSRTVVSGIADRMLAGAGEFGDVLSAGAGTFDISWRECFSLCCTSAGVIAGNTNQLKVSLDAIDQDHARSITF